MTPACLPCATATHAVRSQSFLRNVFGGSAKERRNKGLRREGSFLVMPNGGWLHDEFALAYGDGLYYR